MNKLFCHVGAGAEALYTVCVGSIVLSSGGKAALQLASCKVKRSELSSAKISAVS